MGKDPALLFYPSDFLTGTMMFTNEQAGKYIRLLCAQHQHGHLTEDDMINVCSTYDRRVFEKFEQDADGKYFNRRLDEEIFRRKNFCESRRQSRLKGIDKKKNSERTNDVRHTYEGRMETITETINITNTINKKEPKIKVADFVSMTQKEVDTLRSEFSESQVSWMVDKLNTYKGSKGVKYKSDYMAIRSWVVKSLHEEKSTGQVVSKAEKAISTAMAASEYFKNLPE